jgi:hypothetical protein
VRRLRKHGTDRAECLTNTYSFTNGHGFADAHAYSFANAWTVVGVIDVAIVHGDGANTKPHCR